MDIKPIQPQQQNQNNDGQPEQKPNSYAEQPNYFNRPINSQNRPQQNQTESAPASHVKNSHNFIFGYIGLIVLAIAVAGVYYWQNGIVKKDAITISSQQGKINALTDQNSTLLKNNATLKSQVTNNTPVKTTVTSLAIPSLGITISNIPEALSGLSDNFTKTSNTDVFSTATLTTADAKCSATAGIGIGSLVKVTGTYTAGTTTLKTGETFVKQLTTGTAGTYLITVKPSGTCSTVTATNTLQTTQATLLQTLLTTPANITAS